jgi:hypothetical protein
MSSSDTTRATEHRLLGPNRPTTRPKDDDLVMRAQVRDILWCIECHAVPGPDHPTPPTCSNHTWLMFSRVFIAIDGGPLYCHDCQRTIKGAGGHQDHAVQQIIDSETAHHLVGMFGELHEGLDEMRASATDE